MKNKTSKFKPEDIVRVLPGVKDPDFGIDIGGWSGKVEDITLSNNGSWLYTIIWDKDTLSMAGENYVTQCEKENLNFEIIYLEEKELELVEDTKIMKNGFLLV